MEVVCTELGGILVKDCEIYAIFTRKEVMKEFVLLLIKKTGIGRYACHGKELCA